MLLHFVFCLSPCNVNICYLNECYFSVFEVLHFALYFGSWKENLGSVRWPEAPNSHWHHSVTWDREESCLECTLPLLLPTCFIHCFIHVDMYTHPLTQVYIDSLKKPFPANLLPATASSGKHKGESEQWVAKITTIWPELTFPFPGSPARLQLCVHCG